MTAALDAAGVDAASVSHVVVGTTIGINAVLTRTGARVLYLTTKGFEDIPFIQRISRKYHYDYRWRKPTPLVSRGDCIGVDERLDEEGRELVPLDGDGLREELARRDLNGGRTAIAVCYLFSYLEPSHELATRELLRGARRAGRIALARDRADLARVRARLDRDRRRLPEAAVRRLRRRARGGPLVAFRGCALLAAQVERRARARRGGPPAPGAPPPLRNRRRRHRRRVVRAQCRRRAGDHARHGRNELRRLPDRGRRAALLLRLRDRVRLPRQRAGGGDEDDRRGRRLDRMEGPGRLPAGRAAERGRGSRPGLLRPGRGGGDAHGRQPRARPAEPRVLPRRPAAAPSRPRGGGPRAARRGARPRPARGRVEHGADREREHGERDPHRHRGAGDRPPRLRSRRHGRGRADARRRDRRRDRDAARARAAEPGPRLRLRGRGRAAQGRRGAQRAPPRHARDRIGAGRPPRGARGPRRRRLRGAVGRRLAERRAPLRGAALPRTELRAGGRRAGWRAFLRRAGGRLRGLRPALRGLLRLPARRHPDRARPAVGGRDGRGARALATPCRRERRRRRHRAPAPGLLPRPRLRRDPGRPPLDACLGRRARRAGRRRGDGLDDRRAARLVALRPAGRHARGDRGT